MLVIVWFLGFKTKKKYTFFPLKRKDEVKYITAFR